jgi:hypothetical protein
LDAQIIGKTFLPFSCWIVSPFVLLSARATEVPTEWTEAYLAERATLSGNG